MKKILLFILLTLTIIASSCTNNDDLQSEETGNILARENEDNNEAIDSYGDEQSKENEWLYIKTYKGSELYVNVTEALNNKAKVITKDELTEKYIVPEIEKDYFIEKISQDGFHALLRRKQNGNRINEDYYTYNIIYNLRSKEVEKEFELVRSIVSDVLNTYIYRIDSRENTFHYELSSKTHFSLDKLDFYSVTHVLSYDNKYYAAGVEEGSDCYIYIFDIENNKILEKVHLGKNDQDHRIPIWVTQWHKNNEIYYNFGHYAYKYNFDTKEITELGKYMFYPFLSGNEKYLMYSKPDLDTSEYIVSDKPDYGETGLFVRNLETNEDIKILKDNDYLNEGMILMQLIYTTMDYTE